MIAPLLSGLCLPFQFDVELLQRDLSLVAPAEWTPHYNERDFGGEWRGAALRSATGVFTDLTAGPAGPGNFSDTPLLARCPFLREVLSAFACPLKSVRLLGLAPGSFIREHSDHALGYEDGEVRIHIPILTNPAVEFYLAGERLLLDEGRAYYVNVNLPHRVNNAGADWRVHLVIDAQVNPWITGLFASSRPIPLQAPPPLGFAEFRELVFCDPSLQRTLHPIADRDVFLTETVRLGQERGFHFSSADIEATQTPPTPAGSPDPDWIPIAVRTRDSGPVAEWIRLEHPRFEALFFEDTLRDALQNPFTRAFRRELPLAPAPPGTLPVPAGFIFHMSRCGSTLLAQLLATLPRHTVISEAPPIDDAIQTHDPGILRAIAGALCHGPTFIKLDAWHIRSLPLIRAAFPAAPWVFLYRDPLEVVASHLRRPGRQALPGAMHPAQLGLELQDITRLSRDEWCVRVLAGFCTAALRFRDEPNGLLLDYRDLPGAAWEQVARHFGISVTAAEIERMRAASRFDAKDPRLPFRPAAAPGETLSLPLLKLCRETLTPLYESLRRAPA